MFSKIFISVLPARTRTISGRRANGLRLKNAFVSRASPAGPKSSPVQYLKNTGLLVCPGVWLDFLDFLDQLP